MMTAIRAAFQPNSPLVRILKYAAVRAVMLFFAVVVSVFLTVSIAGRSGVIESEISGSKLKGWFSGIFQPNLRTTGTETPSTDLSFLGTLQLVFDGLTFNLGKTDIIYLYNSEGTTNIGIQSIILDFLSRTLVLFGFTNLLLFIISIWLGLMLYRNYGSFLDKLVVTLSPLSSVPAWIYGLVLIVFSARVLHYYPSGLLTSWSTGASWTGVWFVLQRFLLPVLAIFLSKIFLSVYTWRTFFLIHGSEDYVEMAKARGLPKRMIDRFYILQPSLPSLLTSFATMVIGIWQEAIVLELFFGVAGIGHLFYSALRRSATEMPLLVSLTVMFAYLMAISVFILDIAYVIVDPRVKVELGGESKTPLQRASFRGWLRSLKNPRIRWQPEHFSGPPGVLSTSKRDHGAEFRYFLSQVKSGLTEFGRYPSAVLGLVIVLGLVGVSIFTVTSYPYQETIAQWRNEGDYWKNNPKNAAPAWLNYFLINKLPETVIQNTRENPALKTVTPGKEGASTARIEFPLDYPYADFPTEMVLRLHAKLGEKTIFISPTWIMPDGREIHLKNITLNQADSEHHLLLEDPLQRKTGDQTLKRTLFSVKDSSPATVLQGRYTLRLDVFMFEPINDLDAELILQGVLYGLAGTDNMRRNLLLPLLWGAPIALTFGLLGAICASLLTMSLAAISTWFGGWIENVIQRLTEINMVLPAFPVLVLVYISISKNIWMILGLAILLNVMNNAIKNYRAVFLQIKEAGYIEAAQAYGASNWRIIFMYLIPRILPVLIPQLVILAPGLIFLEATLAFLNISDPTLPTWGKLIQESISDGALNGYYYQIMEPIGLLLVTGLALSMVGFSLDRILNPRLRDR